nr:protein SIEVE ELEMENT OCCLUSION B-like [Ipomoea batatas]
MIDRSFNTSGMIDHKRFGSIWLVALGGLTRWFSADRLGDPCGPDADQRIGVIRPATTSLQRRNISGFCFAFLSGVNIESELIENLRSPECLACPQSLCENVFNSAENVKPVNNTVEVDANCEGLNKETLIVVVVENGNKLNYAGALNPAYATAQFNVGMGSGNMQNQGHEVSDVNAFIKALDKQLRGLYTKHHCTRMVMPAAVGRYPKTVACVECWRTMEKFFMYMHARHLRHHPRSRLPPTTPILGSASSSVTDEEKSQSSLLCYSRSCSSSRANGSHLYYFSMRGLSFEGTATKLCL